LHFYQARLLRGGGVVRIMVGFVGVGVVMARGCRQLVSLIIRNVGKVGIDLFLVRVAFYCLE